MNTLTASVVVATSMLVGALDGVGEPLQIISFESKGQLGFSGATPGNFFTLEFAPSPTGPWTNWGSVVDQPVTGLVMQTPTPMFFRIMEMQPESVVHYATGTPVYVEQDPVWSTQQKSFLSVTGGTVQGSLHIASRLSGTQIDFPGLVVSGQTAAVQSALEFVPSSTPPIESDRGHMWVDTAGHLQFRDYGGTTTRLDEPPPQSSPRSAVRVLCDGTTIDHGTWVKVTFNNKVYDTRVDFNTSTHRFTARTAGFYLVSTAASTDYVGGGGDDAPYTVYLAIYKNGTMYSYATIRHELAQNSQYGKRDGLSLSDVVNLSVGDYIEIWGRAEAGDNIELHQGNEGTGGLFLTIHELGQ